ncbi:UNVERIFIED_CONTAM: hypothetical protein Sradi_4736400 [Sesamum radiatum]|uniref:Uncharacterized protein n=1 Tax=Sesamum radiatum TaxID=300843 RepID=A0AAW2MX17_SESRA
MMTIKNKAFRPGAAEDGRPAAARAARRWCALVCRGHGGVLTARRTAPQWRAEARTAPQRRAAWRTGRGAERRAEQRRGRLGTAPEAAGNSAGWRAEQRLERRGAGGEGKRWSCGGGG